LHVKWINTTKKTTIMKKNVLLTLVFLSFAILPIFAQSTDKIRTKNGFIAIHPIHHATLALGYADKTIYVDPTGGTDVFAKLNKPDIILITDIHPDHFDVETLKELDTKNTLFIIPKAVAKRMPNRFSKQLLVLANGETTSQANVKIHAIPMYNLPKKPDAYHPKGRGNGYVLTIDEKRIYIAGDTEDIPEMRSLQDIDVAFIPMNLPYTMNVEQAADAVLAFKPTIVYPYHYSGSDIQKFKCLVNEDNPNIEVRLRNWYPNK